MSVSKEWLVAAVEETISMWAGLAHDDSIFDDSDITEDQKKERTDLLTKAVTAYVGRWGLDWHNVDDRLTELGFSD